MTGFNSKRTAVAEKLQEPSTITFSAIGDWVMRITADRRIEVNEGVEVTEAAQKVLEAMQWMLKPAQEPVAYVTGMSFGRFIVEPLNPAMVLPIGMALYSAPQENK